MVKETVLAHAMSNMLENRSSIDLILASDMTPNEFSRTMFFCPVQSAELYRLLKKDIKYGTEEYTKLQHIKRKQLSELYNGVAAFMMAIVNTDAIITMRNSLKLLNDGIDDSDSNLKELNDLGKQTEQLIVNLAEFPINVNSSKELSDVVQIYNKIIIEKIIPEMEYNQKYYNLGKKLDSTNDRLKLYVKYGVTRDCTHFKTFEMIMDYLQAAGFGYSHFAFTPDGVDHRYTDHAKNSLKLHLTTMSNILFHMISRPNSDQEVRNIYNLGNDILVPSPLQPMELGISTRNYKTPHAKFLETCYDRLIGQFNKTQAKLNTKDYPLLFCPPQLQHY